MLHGQTQGPTAIPVAGQQQKIEKYICNDEKRNYVFKSVLSKRPLCFFD